MQNTFKLSSLQPREELWRNITPFNAVLQQLTPEQSRKTIVKPKHNRCKVYRREVRVYREQLAVTLGLKGREATIKTILETANTKLNDNQLEIRELKSHIEMLNKQKSKLKKRIKQEKYRLIHGETYLTQ